jgi:DNA modification methylase
MEEIIKNCLDVTNENCIFAWLVGRGSSEHKDHVAHISFLLEKNGLIFQDAIAWIKPGANYTIKRSCHIRLNGYYYPAFKWENIVIYRKGKAMPKMSDYDRNYMAKHHTDVWKIPWVTQQAKRFGHPSVCPEEIPSRCIYAYTKK